jgi:predicted ATP-dependent Lon-type protease
MVVLGKMSLGGDFQAVDRLNETLQLALHSGPNTVRLPLADKADIANVAAELFTKFQTDFYSDLVHAVCTPLEIQSHLAAAIQIPITSKT